MNIFNVIVKANTYIIGFAVFIGLIGAPFFLVDTGGSIKSSKENNDGVVAGAYAETQPTVLPTVIPTSTPTPSPTPIPVAEPARLIIPKLNIDTDIENVGVTPENVMEVPEDFSKVGWFTESMKPGEDGSTAAIMSGHFDTRTGAPAVFYDLEDLSQGDEVMVIAADGITYVFEVDNSFSHPLEDFPEDIVYGEVATRSLKLITCDGVWHTSQQSYSDRLVVTSHLKRIVLPNGS